MTNKRHPLRRERQIAEINARIARLRADINALERERERIVQNAEEKHESST